MPEVRVDQIVKERLARRIAGPVLVRTHIDGCKPEPAPGFEDHPQMRIARRRRMGISVNLAAQAIVVDAGHGAPRSGFWQPRSSLQSRANACNYGEVGDPHALAYVMAYPRGYPISANV